MHAIMACVIIDIVIVILRSLTMASEINSELAY